jgi:hypothetical protein
MYPMSTLAQAQSKTSPAALHASATVTGRRNCLKNIAHNPSPLASCRLRCDPDVKSIRTPPTYSTAKRLSDALLFWHVSFRRRILMDVSDPVNVSFCEAKGAHKGGKCRAPGNSSHHTLQLTLRRTFEYDSSRQLSALAFLASNRLRANSRTKAFLTMKRLANTFLSPFGYELRRRDEPLPVPLNAANARRIAYFQSLLQMIDGVAGDIVECGVYSGLTLYAQALFSENRKPCRNIYGFDSFEGLPEASAEDEPEVRPEAKVKGRFANSMESVIARLLSNGIRKDFVDRHVHLVKGWFTDTLPAFDMSIALLHVDVDLYQSYLDVLENLYPRVNQGGIVAFDEYGDTLWVGASKAIHAYLGESVKIQESDIFPGKHYLVKE